MLYPSQASCPLKFQTLTLLVARSHEIWPLLLSKPLLWGFTFSHKCVALCVSLSLAFLRDHGLLPTAVATIHKPGPDILHCVSHRAEIRTSTSLDYWFNTLSLMSQRWNSYFKNILAKCVSLCYHLIQHNVLLWLLYCVTINTKYQNFISTNEDP